MDMKTKIYTKGGDHGLTSLFGGPRVSKSHEALNAYGTIDELNACLGLCLNHLPTAEVHLAELLSRVQNELFTIGSHLACADESWRDKLPSLKKLRVDLLENQIDVMTDSTPELREFILPGGHIAATHLHLARTVCRRAERATVAFSELAGQVSQDTMLPIIIYLNRLSDFLFVAARFVNFKTLTKEVTWTKP